VSDASGESCGTRPRSVRFLPLHGRRFFELCLLKTLYTLRRLRLRTFSDSLAMPALSENAGNLNRRNTFEVLSSHNEVLGSHKPHSDTARTISVNAAMPIAGAIEENWGRASAIEPG